MPEGDEENDGQLIDLSLVDELIDTYGPSVPHFSATDEGLSAGFLAEIYEYVRERVIEHGKVVAAPCVFVQSRSVTTQASELGADPSPYFRSLPDKQIGGRLFLANDDLSEVHELDASCDTIEDIASTLAKYGLEKQTHAVYRQDRAELIICEAGWAGGTRLVKIRTSRARLTRHELELTVWKFHRQFTQTPAGLLNCWRGKAANRVTAERLERSISGHLAFWLVIIVGQDSVTMEHDTPHGRVDVYVNKHGMDPAAGACVMELKVLRSRQYSASAEKGWTDFSDADMIEHASEGLTQAKEYLDDQRADCAYLMCFDARLTDEDQPEVLALARRMGIEIRRYFMYVTTAAARRARQEAIAKGSKLPGEP